MSEQNTNGYIAEVQKQTVKAVLVEPLNFEHEGDVWVPKSQFDMATLETSDWIRDKLGLKGPLHLQLPDGGWERVEDLNGSNGGGQGRHGPEQRAGREGDEGFEADEPIMTIDEKIARGLDIVAISKQVNLVAAIWELVLHNKTFGELSDRDQGYAVSGIFREITKDKRTLLIAELEQKERRLVAHRSRRKRRTGRRLKEEDDER